MTTLSLKDSGLLRQRAYIAGRWCEADNRKSFLVTNPATGEVLAQVPDMEAAETRRAIEAAKAAMQLRSSNGLRRKENESMATPFLLRGTIGGCSS